jgi:thiamine kinase-like enzyme
MESEMITWQEIEAALPTLKPATDGFSIAKRGVITLKGGQKCFVKIGTDDYTKQHANREIEIYKWLNAAAYAYAPRLLASTDGGFAIEDLSAYDFSTQWSQSKLSAVFAAIAALKKVPHKNTNVRLKRLNISNGWQLLQKDERIFTRLVEKLAEHNIALNPKMLDKFVKKTDSFEKIGNDIIHGDIRGDNLAYDAAQQKVYLVDWNWCALGSTAFEYTPFLVNVQNNGFDVRRHYPEHIDPTCALFMAGFWLYHSLEPIWEGGNPALRDRQFQCGLIALEWSKQ